MSSFCQKINASFPHDPILPHSTAYDFRVLFFGFCNIKFLYKVLSELRFKKGRNLAKFGESDMVPNFVATTHMSDF